MFTIDGTAKILADGRCFVEDPYAKLDPATGNILTIPNPWTDTTYSVAKDVAQKDGKYYTLDTTCFGRAVNGKTVAYTEDFGAYIDPTTKAVYTTDGEDTLASTPKVPG